MLIRHPSDIPSSEITPEDIYHNRREFMRGALGIAALGLTPGARSAPSYVTRDSGSGPQWLTEKIGTANPDSEKTQEPLTPYQHVTSYNNFYEFGYDKSDPAKHAGEFQPHPWQVEIAGAVNKPGVYHLEDLLKGLALEERVYRLRCVEAWSMVIPWIGFSLAELLKRFEPTSAARYVAFTTLVRPEEMPAQKKRLGTIEWPYREGLRLDEALHPLTLMAVGLYGKVLPNQNGAPLRLVVPWKYGFKSIKSIVKIELTEHQPYTSWSAIAPKEYGFYANVNPQVDHPRWSQAQERRLPGGLLKPNILPTQLFNGYGDQVAHMYRDMDLHKYY